MSDLKDARKLPIEQPPGSSVYFRPLSQVILFRVLDATGLPWIDSVYETRWADHMPLARRRVHPD